MADEDPPEREVKVISFNGKTPKINCFSVQSFDLSDSVITTCYRPPCIQDFQFHLATKVRLQPSTDTIPSERVNLLAVANKFGLIFAGTKDGE